MQFVANPKKKTWDRNYILRPPNVSLNTPMRNLLRPS